MDHFERDLMKIWKCDLVWPVCLYDFAFKNKNPSYLVFKVDKDFDEFIIDGYFTDSKKFL